MSTVFMIALGVFVALGGVHLKSRYLSFSSQRSSDYTDQQPAFDIRSELNGPILCEGVIYGPTGRVASRFVADMDAKWDGNICRMSEAFKYESGKTQDREWVLTLGNDGGIRADAADLVGQGSGQQQGSAVVLRYNIRLPEDSGGHVLAVTDWMYLMPNGTIINRSQFRKFGIKVAELVATMRRVPA